MRGYLGMYKDEEVGNLVGVEIEAVLELPFELTDFLSQLDFMFDYPGEGPFNFKGYLHIINIRKPLHLPIQHSFPQQIIILGQNYVQETF